MSSGSGRSLWGSCCSRGDARIPARILANARGEPREPPGLLQPVDPPARRRRRAHGRRPEDGVRGDLQRPGDLVDALDIQRTYGDPVIGVPAAHAQRLTADAIAGRGVSQPTEAA